MGAPNLIAMEAAAVGVQAGLPMKSTKALSTSVSWSIRIPRIRFSLKDRINSREAPGLLRRIVLTPIRARSATIMSLTCSGSIGAATTLSG